MSVYNLRNPAVKRLMKEAEELSHATDEYHAQPLEDNLFEWHFSIRGPPNSDFEGGIYHGRITLPPDYPMKPPSIILLTPNGRFETNKKICLSISGYHPESWQPSWSIRTALLAIIGFMPTHGNGALGSLDYTPTERKELAVKSQEFKCPDCGSIKEIFLRKKSSELANGTAATELPCNIVEFSTSDEESHKKSEKDITTPDEESNQKFGKHITTPEEESQKKSEKDITTSDEESNKKFEKDISTPEEESHKKSEKDITTPDEESNQKFGKDITTPEEESHKKSEKDITTPDEESNKKFEKDITTPEEESHKKSEKDITTSDIESHKKLKKDITTSDIESHKKLKKDITTSDEEDHTNSEKDITTLDEECHKNLNEGITLDSPVYLNNEGDEDNKQSEEALVIGSKRKPDFYDSKSAKMKLTDETTDLVRDVDVHRKQRDECYIYGKYVAAHLRNYNALTQSVVKHLIGNILFRADIGQLNLNVSSANNSHCFFPTLPTSTVQMQHNNPTQTQIYTPPVTQYSHVASSSSCMGNTIPNMFSNPAISGLFRQNPGIPGLLAQSPRIRGLFGQNLRIPGPIPKFSK